MPASSYRDLRVWSASVDAAISLYALTTSFPKHEMFGITAQLRRASVSVASNIAEGNARSSTRDYLRFLAIARGSLAEIDTQLTIANRLGYAPCDDIHRTRRSFDTVGKMVRRLEQVLHLRNSPTSQ
ncbi:MAG TPA: four helix bundle protein [Casimicrobiaceae bacterium]|nr:four helix bundle protein [Casimicrobiaceae bacterium]